MKTGFTTLLIIMSFYINSQTSNLTIFNNGGQAFFVILNGIKQNSIPKTSLQVTGLQPASYELKLIFADGVTPDLGKSLWLESNFDYTLRVVKNKKNQLKIKGFDQVAISNQPTQTEAVSVCYRPTNTSNFGDQIQTIPNPSSTQSEQAPVQSNSQVDQYGKPTNVNVHGTENIQQVVYDEFGNPINVSIQISGETTSISHSSTSTSQTGTTNGDTHGQVLSTDTQNGVTTTSYSCNHDHNHGTHVHTDGTVHSNSEHVTETAAANENLLDLSTRLTCVNPSNSIDAIVKELKLASFTADQYEILKNKLWNKCVSSSQAEEIVKTFNFESDRLIVAKYCVNRMSDPMNAQVLIDLFNFSSSKSDFMKFLASHR